MIGIFLSGLLSGTATNFLCWFCLGDRFSRNHLGTFLFTEVIVTVVAGVFALIHF